MICAERENSNYSLGIMCWNRSKIEEAKYHFDRAMCDLKKLDNYEKEKLVEFYSQHGDKGYVINILEDMIDNEESIVFAVKSYLDVVGNDIEEEKLTKFQNISQVRLNQEIIYRLAMTYFNKGYRLKSYELLAELLDLMESGDKSKLNQGIYVNSVLKMIELEYMLDNFSQARLQTKKLIVKSFDVNQATKEKVIYWAVVLNILDEVMKRKDWVESVTNIQDKELKVLVYIMYKIYKNEASEKFISLIKNYKFSDEKLKYRSDVMIAYLKKCAKDETWVNELDNIDIKRCYMAVLMSYEKQKLKNDFDSEKFLKEYYEYHSDMPQIINSFWNRGKVLSSKELDDVSVQFIGGADGIGGSCVLVRYKDMKILLDAGANINSNEFLPKFERMKEEGVELEDIDYLIISHGHLDHTGAAPYIYSQNPNIKIISTEDTKDIMKVMLEDTAKINERKDIDVFDIQDVKNLVANVDVVNFDTKVKLSDDISICLYRAGHILGAACIYIEVNETKILYTGDYSVSDQHTVKGMCLPKDLQVDILITESTYAYQPTNFDLRKELREKMLVDEILKATKNNGVVLIPAFAVGRAQEIILLIKEYFKDEMFLPFDLYVDGKVVEICSLYEKSDTDKRRSIYGNGVTTVNHRYQGKNEIPINKFRGSCIIASSGMLNDNSRSSKYASTIIEDEKSLILFSGYLDEESPGRQIVNEIKNKAVPVISLEGKAREVKCKVKSYKLSAHVKKPQIIEVIAKLRPRHTFLVHGDVNNKFRYFDSEELGSEIYPEMEEMLKYINSCNIIKPKNGEVFKLTEV